MKIHEIILEGGWDSTVTQGTKITPDVVKRALSVVQRFANDFNLYLKKQGMPAVQMGHPTGSSAHHEVDSREDPAKVYGDIDLQMIAPVAGEAKTHSQYQATWNKASDDFIAATRPSYVHYEGKPANGHIIFAIGADAYVQVDMLWAQPENADWARYRTTPERGIKGTIYGNLYSSLGEIMDMSVQHAGVQMKILDDQPVNFQRGRKFDRIATLSKDISNFGMDVLTNLYRMIHPDLAPGDMVIDPELRAHPGLNKEKPAVADLVAMIRGLANSFEANDMYGRFNLKGFTGAQDFVAKFLQHYEGKAAEAMAATKFDKAETPDAKARAQDAKDKLAQGVQLIRKLFQQ